jgi:hypothetical protein
LIRCAGPLRPGPRRPVGRSRGPAASVHRESTQRPGPDFNLLAKTGPLALEEVHNDLGSTP